MDKIVIICSTGRSGSTTLLRLINTIPNSNICGENDGAINSLLTFYEKLNSSARNIPGNYKPKTYEEVINKNIKPSWYNSYKIEEMKEKIRELVIAMFKKSPETTLWGFKEIRWDNIQLISTFKKLFPQTKVIINIRDVESQIKSGWYKSDKNAKEYLTQMNKTLLSFGVKNRCYIANFETMFQEENIKKMFAFIGCLEHYDASKINDVLDNNLCD